MTYNPNIPQATDIISQSQGQILTNFNQANTIFDVDHITFDAVAAANRGKHDKSTYVELAADPVTVFNEVAVYSKDLAGFTRLFLRQENNGTVIQTSGRDPTIAVNGETYLPGGLLMKWGQSVCNGNTAIAFPTAFPVGCFVVLAQPIDSNPAIANGYVYVSAFAAAGFTATGVRRTSLAAAGVTFSYLAIGL